MSGHNEKKEKALIVGWLLLYFTRNGTRRALMKLFSSFFFVFDTFCFLYAHKKQHGTVLQLFVYTFILSNVTFWIFLNFSDLSSQEFLINVPLFFEEIVYESRLSLLLMKNFWCYLFNLFFLFAKIRRELALNFVNI